MPIKIEPEIIDGDDDAAEMQAELERSAGDMEKMRKALEHERETNARLREQLGGRKEANEERIDDDYEGGHVIDLPGRLRYAWSFAYFRLLVLTLALFGYLWSVPRGAGIAGGAAWGPEVPVERQLWAGACAFLFLAWSVAQFRRLGFAQLLLKWLVYLCGIGACFLLRAESGHWEDWRAEAIALAFVMLVTFSKFSRWLGGQIRVFIWESEPVETVKGWF